ncbi:DUF7319 domain-containing protein [Halococcus thailandensis]|uniref:DUF7319 domain-containing protein n=1 Tax=Halococcus thailandensis JCM 13552 TaxID=1227457 RepID=M0MXW4_9EURY|nr:hypothetical protein [Halococcus thailandensis]EMA50153.1 hypothetical protein C451_16680 [Halococcus thailandensis JCM 13552]
MADSRPTADEGDERAGESGTDADSDAAVGEKADTGNKDASAATDADAADSTDQLRQRVEETYDFDDFGPTDMAQMSADEWDAAFDADSWITGDELLARVEADLRNRIAERDVFARLEGVEDGLLAYSDEGYAVVYPDGSVEGRGTVLRDVKPTVALCSMDDYDVAEPPEGELLPEPSAVPEGGGELGNWMLQLVAAAQLLAGLGLIVAWVFFPVETLFAPVAGIVFALVAILLFVQVANARLSDKFRSEEYRDRLRAVGIGSDERPEFLPERYREPADASAVEGADDDPQTDELDDSASSV